MTLDTIKEEYEIIFKDFTFRGKGETGINILINSLSKTLNDKINNEENKYIESSL